MRRGKQLHIIKRPAIEKRERCNFYAYSGLASLAHRKLWRRMRLICPLVQPPVPLEPLLGPDTSVPVALALPRECCLGLLDILSCSRIPLSAASSKDGEHVAPVHCSAFSLDLARSLCACVITRGTGARNQLPANFDSVCSSEVWFTQPIS